MPASESELTMRPTPLGELARMAALTLIGPDKEIVAFGGTSSRSEHADRLIAYATSPAYLQLFADRRLGAVVIPESLRSDLPEGCSALVSAGDAAEAFYELLGITARLGLWRRLSGFIDPGADVAPSARIHESVVVGRGSRVMDNAVLLPNTWLGADVVVKPNATLGGDGFQISQLAGRQTLVPHVGGVRVADGATIGSQTCVDRGLFGDFTTVGHDTHIDNLVHVAHSVVLGSSVGVVACAEISGSVNVGDGAWLGPRCAINPSLNIGAHAFVGTGATVVRDVPGRALVYGSPAKIKGWTCDCRTALDVVGDVGRCPACGREHRLNAEHLDG